MRNKITADFAARFGIDFLSLPHKRRKGWRVAAYEERVFGHARSIPEPRSPMKKLCRREILFMAFGKFWGRMPQG